MKCDLNAMLLIITSECCSNNVIIKILHASAVLFAFNLHKLNISIYSNLTNLRYRLTK